MTTRQLIEGQARASLVDPQLVEALIITESTGDEWAYRPEPKYPWLWDVRKNAPFRPLTAEEAAAKFPPADFHSLRGSATQEWWGQQASWGWMQVMGAVAREYGFRGPYLTELSDPVINLQYGCTHLSALLKWASGNREKALAAYNGGKSGNHNPPYRNADYVKKVLGNLVSIQKGQSVIV